MNLQLFVLVVMVLSDHHSYKFISGLLKFLIGIYKWSKISKFFTSQTVVRQLQNQKCVMRVDVYLNISNYSSLTKFPIFNDRTCIHLKGTLANFGEDGAFLITLTEKVNDQDANMISQILWTFKFHNTYFSNHDENLALALKTGRAALATSPSFCP